MKARAKPSRTIDEYIAGQPEPIRPLLRQMRAAIRRAAPKAEEAIKYGMPTFVQEGNLVHFAAFKRHLGFYPVPRSVEPFATALAAYPGNKGTAQFSYDRPLPIGLIGRIVRYWIRKNRESAPAREAR